MKEKHADRLVPCFFVKQTVKNLFHLSNYGKYRETSLLEKSKGISAKKNLAVILSHLLFVIYFISRCNGWSTGLDNRRFLNQ